MCHACPISRGPPPLPDPFACPVVAASPTLGPSVSPRSCLSYLAWRFWAHLCCSRTLQLGNEVTSSVLSLGRTGLRPTRTWTRVWDAPSVAYPLRGRRLRSWLRPRARCSPRMLPSFSSRRVRRCSCSCCCCCCVCLRYARCASRGGVAFLRCDGRGRAYKTLRGCEL